MDIIHNYAEKGAGEELILLHGNGESSEYFKYQTEYFSEKYRVIALDTRGHGLTPRGGAPFTIRQFADDLDAFMSRLNIDSANILGFSDGGNIALVFALKYPRRVKRLIVCGANLFPRGVKFCCQAPVAIGYCVASLFSGISARARQRAEMLGLMVRDPFISPDELRNIAAPTLVIAGTRDMIIERHTRLIAESIPGARLVILPGTHFVAAEDPAVFNRVIDEYLRIN